MPAQPTNSSWRTFRLIYLSGFIVYPEYAYRDGYESMYETRTKPDDVDVTQYRRVETLVFYNDVTTVSTCNEDFAFYRDLRYIEEPKVVIGRQDYQSMLWTYYGVWQVNRISVHDNLNSTSRVVTSLTKRGDVWYEEPTQS